MDKGAFNNNNVDNMKWAGVQMSTLVNKYTYVYSSYVVTVYTCGGLFNATQIYILYI